MLVNDEDALVQPFVDAVQQDSEISIVCFSGQIMRTVTRCASSPRRATTASRTTTAAASLRTSQRLTRPRSLELRSRSPGTSCLCACRSRKTETGPLVMEAEFIEPELLLRHDPEAAARLARDLAARLEPISRPG